MPTVCENSYVDQVFNAANPKIKKATDAVREAVEPMILPDAAKLLVAVAADIASAIQTRNDRPDVKAAVAALQASLAVLQAVDSNLNG